MVLQTKDAPVDSEADNHVLCFENFAPNYNLTMELSAGDITVDTGVDNNKILFEN